MNPRAQAALIVNQVTHKQRSLDTALSNLRSKQPSGSPPRRTEEDYGLIQELSYGTLRFYYRLKLIGEKLLLSPLKPKYQDVFALLLVGLYQLLYTDIPEYAAVSETVTGAKTLKKPWATGLLNKTLRRFIKEKNEFLALADKELSSRYAHPLWFIEAIQKAWPNDWEIIIAANNSRPPMVLRVNSQKISCEDYLSLLKENHLSATRVPNLPYAIQLEKPVPVKQLPKFEEGFVYIQDSAGQYTARLLDLKPQQRVLDACAAPGSKTTHILETEVNLKALITIDSDSNRMGRIKENIARLGLATDNITLITADAADIQKWWDGRSFDRILLDAPCSATGTIRRHPDIKILRKESDVAQHAEVQIKLLDALWPLLKENGLLLYSTCSILPEENENTIDKFLSGRDDAKALPIEVGDSIALTHGRQLLPEENGHDGFYYALLQKARKTQKP